MKSTTRKDTPGVFEIVPAGGPTKTPEDSTTKTGRGNRSPCRTSWLGVARHALFDLRKHRDPEGRT